MRDRLSRARKEVEIILFRVFGVFTLTLILYHQGRGEKLKVSCMGVAFLYGNSGFPIKACPKFNVGLGKRSGE